MSTEYGSSFGTSWEEVAQEVAAARERVGCALCVLGNRPAPQLLARAGAVVCEVADCLSIILDEVMGLTVKAPCHSSGRPEAPGKHDRRKGNAVKKTKPVKGKARG